MPYEAVLETLSAHVDPFLPSGKARPFAEESAAEEKDQASQAYIRGVDAALRDQHYRAVLELQRARDLDPASTEVLRHLARSYEALGNDQLANVTFDAILELDPSDGEGLFYLAQRMVTANKREAAGAVLSHALSIEGALSFDIGGEGIALMQLSRLLAAEGYDTALVKAGNQAIDALATMGGSRFRRLAVEALASRAETHRHIGDAHLRLGDVEKAIAEYDLAASLAGEHRPAIWLRLAVAHVEHDTAAVLVRDIVEAIESDKRIADDPRVMLAAEYITGHARPDAKTQRRLDTLVESGDLSARRIALMLLEPDSAKRANRLQIWWEENPESEALLSDWLRSLVATDPVDAARTIIDHAQIDIGHAAVSRSLVASTQLIERLEDVEPGPRRDALISMLHRLREDPASAWRTAQRGLDEHGANRDLVIALLEAAGALQEPGLVDEAAEHAEAFDEPAVWLARCRARRAVLDAHAAVDAAERAIELAPASARAYHELALSRAMLGVVDQAAKAAESAIQADPHFMAPYAFLIDIFGREGARPSPQQLQSVLRALVRQAPENPLVWRLRGAEAASRMRHENTIDWLIPACVMEPYNRDALNALITSWRAMHRDDLPLRWLETRLNERPDDPVLLDAYGSLLIATGDLDEALATCSETASQDAFDIRSLLRERVLRAAGQEQAAYRLAERRISARPHGWQRTLLLVDQAITIGQMTTAASELVSIIDTLDRVPYVIALRGFELALQLDGSNKQVADTQYRYILGYIDREPNAPAGVYARGLAGIAQHADADAPRFVELASRAIARAEPVSDRRVASIFRWYREIALRLYETGRPAHAAAVCMMRLDRSEAPARELYGRLSQLAQACAVAADDIDSAVALIERTDRDSRLIDLPLVSAQTPTQADALYSLSVLCTMLGDEATSGSLLRSALDREPDHVMAQNNLGYQRIEQGHHDSETVAMIEAALAGSPRDSNILDTAGWLRYRQGRFERNGTERGALELLLDAQTAAQHMQQDPSAEVADHLGDTYWRLDRHDEATEAWQEARRILTAPARRSQRIAEFQRYQNLGWGIVLDDPAALYQRAYGRILESVVRKLEQAARGESPEVAQTFAEMKVAEIQSTPETTPETTSDGDR